MFVVCCLLLFVVVAAVETLRSLSLSLLLFDFFLREFVQKQGPFEAFAASVAVCSASAFICVDNGNFFDCFPAGAATAYECADCVCRWWSSLFVCVWVRLYFYWVGLLRLVALLLVLQMASD